ncbi:MAG: carboxypeptidase regulatory-like domain-containing protein [Nitrospirae bacterium]|nr:MAG: carboxypeptidase regulatory-like domain-containing protein [Nitrospirota bacterium]
MSERSMKRHLIILLITSVSVPLMFFGGALKSWGYYEVIDVVNGGTIQGHVTLVGRVPEPRAYNLVIFPDPEYCGRISNGEGWRLLHDFKVAENGGLQDVVVLLEGVQAGKPFSLSIPRIEARDCQFLPFTTVVRSGHGVEVVNMDPVMHDIQAYETSRTQGTRVLFNSPLPFNRQHRRGDLYATHDHDPSKSLVKQFRLSKGRRTFVMQCGFHAYMESWAIAVENPYYALTDREGQFSIDQIPPGTYELRAWHPAVRKTITKRIVVAPGATITVNIELPAPRERRTVLTVRRPPRFTPAALGRPVTIQPIVERQR